MIALYRILPGSMETAKHSTGRFVPHSVRHGAVLVAVLIVVVLLALAAYGYTDLMTKEYKASDQAVRIAQAQAAAESGVHFVAAALADQASIDTVLSGNPYYNPSVFQGMQIAPSDNPRFNAKCSIICPQDSDPSGLLGTSYGVADETGKINLNALMMLDSKGTALYNMLMKLPNMTPDIANSIVFWLDPSATARASSDGGMGAADSSYYETLVPPYRAKNGPIDSVEELLLVSGVTEQYLFGADINRNGIQDPGEEAPDGVFDRGWSAAFTIYSRESNKDSEGTDRININDADMILLEGNLTSAGFDQEMIAYILLYRNNGAAATTTTTTATATTTGDGGTAITIRAQTTTTTDTSTTTPGTLGGVDIAAETANKGSKKFTSLFDLVDTSVQVANTNPKGKPILYTSPISSADTTTMHEQFAMVFDKLALNADKELVGRININTAPEAVLRTLPNLTEEQVDTILEERPQLTSSEGIAEVFKSPAWLITEAGIPAATVKKLEKYITTNSQVYRFQVVGFFDEGGTAIRLEAVVDANGGYPRILYQRDLGSELGKGFVTNGG